MATVAHTHASFLDPAALEAVIRPTADASGLPNSVYTSAEFIVHEREQLFARTWTCVGFASDIPEPGDLRPFDLLGVPLFLARDRAGGVRVFHNVCSHRGAQLVSEPCHVQGLLRCPYHSWTYELDGSLRGTPHFGGTGKHSLEGFDRSSHGLREVRADIWLDLVFVNLAGNAPPLAEHLAPLEGRWRPLWGEDGAARLRRAVSDDTLELPLEANWKLAVENYCESYHLPWVHPGLNSYSRIEDHYHIQDEGPFAGQGTRVYSPLVSDEGGLARFPDWPEEAMKRAEYTALFPNVLLGLHADHFFAILLEPRGPGLTLERLVLYYLDDSAASDSLANTRRNNLATWRAVFVEDVDVVQRMQRGRASPAFSGGVFSPVMDTPTHSFHRWVAGMLSE